MNGTLVVSLCLMISFSFLIQFKLCRACCISVRLLPITLMHKFNSDKSTTIKTAPLFNFKCTELTLCNSCFLEDEDEDDDVPASRAAWRGGQWRRSRRSVDAASVEPSAPDAEWPPPPLVASVPPSSSRSTTWAATAAAQQCTRLVTDRISATATVSAPKLRQRSVSARFWFRLTEFQPSYGYGRNQHRVTAACRKCSTSVTFRPRQ